MKHRILRLPAVIERTGLSRSSIYLRMNNNEFPQPVSLGGRAIGWVESDVNNWLEIKIEASKQTVLNNG